MASAGKRMDAAGDQAVASTMTTGDEALVQTLRREGAPAAGAEEAAGAALPTGTGRFERRRELGRGGMGRVLEAVDRQFNRVVALKEMHAEETGGEARRRFSTEALVTGNLEHPGIPSVYERGVDDHGVPYYAMRKISGRTLAAALGEARTLAERLALLPVVLRTAQTVGYAHERGVIHRDIKPDNIIVGAHGDVVLLDWGIARVRGLTTADEAPVAAPAGGGPGESNPTLFGSVVGTPSYMPPEQACGQTDAIDERTDVFALGALLYHLVTGRPPYQGATVREVLDQARAARPTSPAELEPQVPPALAAICTRAMARSAAERYRNANEMAQALESFESAAFLARPGTRISTAAVGAAIAFAVAAVGSGLAAMTLELPGFTSAGYGVLPAVLLTLVGCGLSMIEIKTRGRLALSSLSLAFALTTICAALAALATGVGKTLVAAHHLAPDAEAYRRAVGQGSWEATDLFLLAIGLATAQILAWGIARRVVEIAQRGEGAPRVKRTTLS